jgi:hypothetical protein
MSNRDIVGKWMLQASRPQLGEKVTPTDLLTARTTCRLMRLWRRCAPWPSRLFSESGVTQRVIVYRARLINRTRPSWGFERADRGHDRTSETDQVAIVSV